MSVGVSQQSSYEGTLRLGTVSLGGVVGYERVLGLPQWGWRTVPTDAGANCPASSGQRSS